MPLKSVLILCLITFGFSTQAQVTRLKSGVADQLRPLDTTQHKMLIEIWSDIMCPFCYIGKRKFEAALAQFENKEDVHITWKSYQLSPDMITDPRKNINQFLAEHKGISVEEAKRMNEYVTGMAAQVGLTYNFDKTIVANSFNAHRFAHFAKVHGKQDAAEEKLFSAYFNEGKNLDDYSVLIELGKEIGLDPIALKVALESGAYTEDVRTDIREAEQLGLRGVPFFVFDRKYRVSGAQDSKVFLQTLEKAYQERL
ncbi:MAG: DsbA family oxidoreductase [Saprospiraceae bacterium]|mgnify:CR=1 FL=1|nr:DsbA family oxidoreductase [Saprospiraceae bacterium]